MSSGKPGFRSDIQGLRALAVLLVCLDHAHVGPFDGGYVGVDVFFVISGFLITGLLVSEAESRGRVSLLGFYARRARRILPAASLVLLTTVAVSTYVLSAVEAEETIGDALWATFFAVNFKLARDGVDYFQVEELPSPLQHYWSLAVEEQFYLAWPLLVLVLVLLAGASATRATRSARKVRNVAVPVLVAIIAASFVWSVVQTVTDPVAAFFSPFTRAWELGLGALVAILAPRLTDLPPGARAVMSWIGLGAVMVSALFYTDATPFPGSAAAVPVLGTVLLLVGGLAAARGGPQAMLSLRPVRAVGDWSYSVYLWHWPALIFIAALWRPVSGWSGLLVLAGVIVVSGLTYRYVEQPWRRTPLLRAGPRRGVLLYPAVVVITLPFLLGAQAVVERQVSGGGPAITTQQYGGEPGDPAPDFSTDPYVALVEASVLAAENGLEVPASLTPEVLDLDEDIPDVGECEYFFINSERPLCPRGDTEAERSLVVIGDSHARQWIPALEVLAKQYGYTTYYLVRQGCPAADVTPLVDDRSGPNEHCASFQDWAVRQVEALQPEVVVMASDLNRTGVQTDDGAMVTDMSEMLPLFEEGLERQIARVSPHTDRVVLLGDPPSLDFSPGRCLSRRDATLAGCMGEGDETSEEIIAAFREAARATDTDYVETGQWFCAQDQCPTIIGDFIARRDRSHMSTPYSEYLAPELGERLRLGG